MRKIIIIALALVISLSLLLALSSVALAWGNENVTIAVSDITIYGIPFDPSTKYYVGDTVTASGTVTIVSNATAGGENQNSSSHTQASSNAQFSINKFSITNPNGNLIATGNNSENAVDNANKQNTAYADASQVFPWSSTFTLDVVGQYIISQGGEASASWRTTQPRVNGSDSASVYNTINLASLPRPGQTYAGVVGKLLIVLEGQQSLYDLDGNTLSEQVETKTNPYKLAIPEETVITNLKGEQVYYLEVTVHEGTISFQPMWVSFSQPITLYQLVGGEWAEILTFDQIGNGQALPL